MVPSRRPTVVSTAKSRKVCVFRRPWSRRGQEHKVRQLSHAARCWLVHVLVKANMDAQRRGGILPATHLNSRPTTMATTSTLTNAITARWGDRGGARRAVRVRSPETPLGGRVHHTAHPSYHQSDANPPTLHGPLCAPPHNRTAIVCPLPTRARERAE